jgi:protein-tyrosine phosphatase
MRWAVPKLLARSPRPGYAYGHPFPVTTRQVEEWLGEARKQGIQGIICLLSDEELGWYSSVPGGLLEYYRAHGLQSASIPVADRGSPPMNEQQLEAVWKAYQSLPKPVLVHCSAGIDRTGSAVEHILAKMKPKR